MPRILLCADDQAAVDEVRSLLEQAGHSLGWHPLAEAQLPELAPYHLIVVQNSDSRSSSLHVCRQLRARLIDSFVPILLLTDNPAPAFRQASLEAGADTCLLRPLAPGDLLAQVQAFLRLKEQNERMTRKSAEVQRVNRRLQQAYKQIDQELELARRIQRSFLPQGFPNLPPLRFAVSYRPCGRVGGDFYDVFRLDEHHLGLYVADAMGHGVPASLLTIYVKKGVRTKEISGKEYRLLPPNEVLQCLNRDLIDQALSENPFITMVYAIIDCRSRTLSFARAGHPHPLYIPREGEPRLWQIEGSLLGVFDSQFLNQSHSLHPGDKVLLYTDGLEPPGSERQETGTSRLVAGACRHRDLPVDQLVENLSSELLREPAQADDFTLLGVEVQR